MAWIVDTSVDGGSIIVANPLFVDNTFEGRGATGSIRVTGYSTTQLRVVLTLVDRTGNPLANLTGIRWAWFDGTHPTTGTVNGSASNGTTNAAGVMEIWPTDTELSLGQTGYLLLYHPDSGRMIATIRELIS